MLCFCLCSGAQGIPPFTHPPNAASSRPRLVAVLLLLLHASSDLPAESLPGSQFGERLLLLVTDPHKVGPLLEQQHAAYLGTVPLRTIVRFTLLQLALLAGVWALVTWAGVSEGGDGVRGHCPSACRCPESPQPSHRCFGVLGVPRVHVLAGCARLLMFEITLALFLGCPSLAPSPGSSPRCLP